jgi:CubicO group peptidase (beta-lactamase class C family)
MIIEMVNNKLGIRMISNNNPVLLLLRDTCHKRICPGAVVCASRKGLVRYDHAIGYASLYPEPVPLVFPALFDVASLTKAVATTSAIMLLIVSGELELDQPIGKFLVGFKHATQQPITIRHLLNHCSGLPDYMPLYEELHAMRCTGEAPALGAESVDWALERISMLNIPPPGQQVIYSDLGFMILGRLVELIATQDLDTFCREQIFLPLGMENTFFLPLYNDTLRKERLRGHQIVATEQCPWRKRLLCGEVHDDNCHSFGGVAGHAGLFSTAHDLHRFAITLLRCSTGASNFFAPALVQEFWRPQQIVSDSTWTLGWDTPSPSGSQAGNMFSANSVGHLGFTGCSMWIDRDEEIIVIFLTNRVHPTRDNTGIRQLRPILHNTIYSLLTQSTHLPPPRSHDLLPELTPEFDPYQPDPYPPENKPLLPPPPKKKPFS